MKNKFIKIILSLKIIMECIFYRKKIVLFCVPYHGNLGDHAIALAEENFFENNFHNLKKRLFAFEIKLLVLDYFSNQKLMNDTTYRSSKLKCTQNYMNLSVLFPVKNSDSKYRVVFYETDSILPKVYDLKNEADLLNVLETVRKNENLQSKKDYDWINIFVRDSVDKVMTLNRVEPLIKIMMRLLKIYL